MKDTQTLDIYQIETAIISGAKFLLQSVNEEDNGIRYEDETSQESGIWITAEALEFFLTTKTLPVVSYRKIQPLIDYLLTKQENDGSWKMVTSNRKSSTISTGHCTYVLKLIICANFLSQDLQNKILNAIHKGEQWLRDCHYERNGCVFWGTEKTKNISPDPNSDERSRKEYVFTTYYAVMGLTNPFDYSSTHQKNSTIINKTSRFFVNQAEWFLEHYNNILAKNPSEDLSNVASTFCRIANVPNLLGGNLFDNIFKEQLKIIIDKCSLNPFTTTTLTVDNYKKGEKILRYNNNTPYDIAIALMNLHTNTETIKKIVQTFVEKQHIDGYWFLGFQSSEKIKTWTTTEAILVLEKAIQSYRFIELEEQKRKKENECVECKKQLTAQQIVLIEQNNQQIEENNRLQEKNDQQHKYLIRSIIISVLLLIVNIVLIAFRWDVLNIVHKILLSIFTIIPGIVTLNNFNKTTKNKK